MGEYLNADDVIAFCLFHEQNGENLIRKGNGLFLGGLTGLIGFRSMNVFLLIG